MSCSRTQHGDAGGDRTQMSYRNVLTQHSLVEVRPCQLMSDKLWSSISRDLLESKRKHYVILPMQLTDIFSRALKMENFQLKKFDIFLIFAQNIDCGYTLEPPRLGGSNEYPQSMFWIENKKNRYTSA